MTPTHEQVLAAIEQTRQAAAAIVNEDGLYSGTELAINRSRQRLADHCDDLRATAERHAPKTTAGGLTYCPHDALMAPDAWPCADYQQVVDRLQSWGYLTERTD